jgi:predicted nucleotidyltransferase component of viral defense system
MIQQTHLTAWQSHAPWPKRSQIEQDLRLSRGVAAIFSDSVLREHLAMRGGTVLHKAHLAPAARYSEDIDLVLVKPMETEILDQHLRRVLQPTLGNPTDSRIADAWLAIRNVLRPSKLLRTLYKFVPLGLAREETIKVEVNLNEISSLYPLVDVSIALLDDEGELVTASARSYDINEMLGTKMRALMQRQQGRDLFDLFHAWQMSAQGAAKHTVDGALTARAFNWYLEQEGTSMGSVEANAALDDRLRNKRFCNDTATLLRPGLPKFDAHVGAGIVRTSYLSHLRDA